MASIKFVVEGTDRGKLLLSNLMLDESLLKSKAKQFAVEFEDIDEELAHWLISNIHALHTNMGAKVRPETADRPAPSNKVAEPSPAPVKATKQPSSKAAE